jgi:hypothetical protein
VGCRRGVYAHLHASAFPVPLSHPPRSPSIDYSSRAFLYLPFPSLSPTYENARGLLCCFRLKRQKTSVRVSNRSPPGLLAVDRARAPPVEELRRAAGRARRGARGIVPHDFGLSSGASRTRTCQSL